MVSHGMQPPLSKQSYMICKCQIRKHNGFNKMYIIDKKVILGKLWEITTQSVALLIFFYDLLMEWYEF